MYDLHGLECSFVHRRLIGAAVGFVTSGGNPLAAAGGFAGGGSVAQPQKMSRAQTFAARRTQCPSGQRMTSGGNCVRDTSSVRTPTPGLTGAVQRFLPGGASGFEVPAGDAVMGRYGAALLPIQEGRVVSTCLPGMVLGDDGNCYDRKAITNRERKYPKGTAPLLTGGDMSCIRKAARAASRLQRTTKRLQKIGLLKR